MKIALACFVKTPHLSNVKTRLAASIGKIAAIEFYQESLKTTYQVLLKVQADIPQLDLYWAIAENENTDYPLWEKLNKVNQGNGDLADRLSHVFESLFEKYDYVCFIGSDSPAVPLEFYQVGIKETINQGKKSTILGPTSDGGFYFMGTGLYLDKKFWKSIEYSKENTLEKLMIQSKLKGSNILLPKSFDIDTIDDLHFLINNKIEGKLLESQMNLKKWTRELLNRPKI